MSAIYTETISFEYNFFFLVLVALLLVALLCSSISINNKDVVFEDEDGHLDVVFIVKPQRYIKHSMDNKNKYKKKNVSIYNAD